MDSMDWFDPQGGEAAVQVRALNRALRIGGRLLLRSAGLKPWYLANFLQNGFEVRTASQRKPGTCIDRYAASFLSDIFCGIMPWQCLTACRVNMYASTWVLVKTIDVATEPASTHNLEKLEI